MTILYFIIAGTGGLAVLFFWLFIRSTRVNSKLLIENMNLKKYVKMQKEQLEIAASSKFNPNDLVRKLREGKL